MCNCTRTICENAIAWCCPRTGLKSKPVPINHLFCLKIYAILLLAAEEFGVFGTCISNKAAKVSQWEVSIRPLIDFFCAESERNVED